MLAVYKIQVVKTIKEKKQLLRQEILDKLLGQSRVDKKVLQNMGNVVTNEFNKKLQNQEQERLKQQLETVTE